MLTPDECFEQLKPCLEQLARKISTAPCNQQGLAVLVATFTMTIAGNKMNLPLPEAAHEVATLIADAAATPRVLQ